MWSRSRDEIWPSMPEIQSGPFFPNWSIEASQWQFGHTCVCCTDSPPESDRLSAAFHVPEAAAKLVRHHFLSDSAITRTVQFQRDAFFRRSSTLSCSFSSPGIMQHYAHGHNRRFALVSTRLITPLFRVDSDLIEREQPEVLPCSPSASRTSPSLSPTKAMSSTASY